jgi:hypothetical protein
MLLRFPFNQKSKETQTRRSHVYKTRRFPCDDLTDDWRRCARFACLSAAFIRHIHHTRRLCACRRQGDPACMQLTTSMSHETIFRRAANVWNFAAKFRTYSSAALHLFIYIKDRIQFQYFLHFTYRGNFMDCMTDYFLTYTTAKKIQINLAEPNWYLLMMWYANTQRSEIFNQLWFQVLRSFSR